MATNFHEVMKSIATLVFVWGMAGVGAVAASILGAAFGPRELFVGAAMGGPIGAVAGVWICVRCGWVARAHRTAASIGAAAGFVVAIPVAVNNLQTPVVPILACSLAGLGALSGAWWANRRAA
jgi:hypothetical protein